MNLSSKLHFRKISSTKYVASYGYSAVACGNRIFILKDGKVAKWQSGFSCIECAEHFLNLHDYINATSEVLPFSTDDLEYVLDVYKFEPERNYWVAKIDSTVLILKVDEDGKSIILNAQSDGKTDAKEFESIDDLILELDSYYQDVDLFSAVSILNTSARANAIEAASNSRDISKNLVRVRSSNIWAYGIDIRDRKSGVGDVYIQFKGKNGGPDDIYVYFDVPVNLWRKFIAAPSKGHFFWMNIRNNFWYRKLTGDKRTKLKNGIN